MDFNKVLITSYNHCDLDGFSCSLAYNEYLLNLGVDSVVKFEGPITLEVSIVCEKFNLILIWEKNQILKIEKLYY